MVRKDKIESQAMERTERYQKRHLKESGAESKDHETPQSQESDEIIPVKPQKVLHIQKKKVQSQNEKVAKPTRSQNKLPEKNFAEK